MKLILLNKPTFECYRFLAHTFEPIYFLASAAAERALVRHPTAICSTFILVRQLLTSKLSIHARCKANMEESNG